mgnify:CR=1 FL=1
MGKSASTERRRGTDLENAILEEAWTELVERGYHRLTMEGVASRAGTSRSVLARRWDGRFSLAVAAIRHQRVKYPLEVEESGDLRTELLDYFEHLSKRATMIAVVFPLLSSEYFQENSLPPQRLREALTQGEGSVLSTIIHRAVERGEIDSRKLNPTIETLLGDLFRYYSIMNFSPPPPELRRAWVDTIFMPLVRVD